MGCTTHRHKLSDRENGGYVSGSLPDLWPCGINHEQPLLSLFGTIGGKPAPQRFSHNSTDAFPVVLDRNGLRVLFFVLPLRRVMRFLPMPHWHLVEALLFDDGFIPSPLVRGFLRIDDGCSRSFAAPHSGL
jgi:hypothetical protein